MDVDVDGNNRAREAYFSQYPQPPALAPEDQARTRISSKVNDEYLTNVELYIDDLSTYIRSVQAQEVHYFATLHKSVDLFRLVNWVLLPPPYQKREYSYRASGARVWGLRKCA
jgi:hypothetical protein